MNKVTGTIIGGVMIVGGISFTDAQINPYVETDSMYELNEVSISKEKPRYILSKWGEEAIVVTREGSFNAQERELFSKELKSESVDGKETMVITPVEGGTKIDLILNEQPLTNIFNFNIEGWEEFDFFYQPVLTQEEIEEGVVRPEDIVGSYAVYHKTKVNNQYKTGKAYHIYRPKIIDANGEDIWGTLSFKNGVLSVTVPQDYLNAATYPVRIDPTFGDTTAGGSTGSTGRIFFYKHAAPESGTVTSMTGYFTHATGVSCGMAYYNGVTPFAKVAEDSGNVTVTTAGFYSTTVSGSISAASYYLAFWNCGTYYYDETGISTEGGTGPTLTFENWPANVAIDSSSTRRPTLYATYTASGGGGLPAGDHKARIEGLVEAQGILEIN